MHKWIALVFLFLAAPVAADTQTEIRTALDYLAQVWNEKDLDAIAGYYHSDFVMIAETGAVSRQQFLDDIAQIGKRGGDRGQLGFSDVMVRPLGDDHAMAFGQSTMSFEDGSSLQTWFTTVYVKTPFGWKALLTRN
jgi:ketosteroid isomerase-like protein